MGRENSMVLFQDLNIMMFSAVHALVGQYSLLDAVQIFAAEYLPYLLVVVLCGVFLYPKSGRRDRIMVLAAFAAALCARFIVKPVILLFVAEPRPFVFLEFTPLITTSLKENMQSFPSGHALFFFALATALYLSHKKIGIVFLIAAVLMGIGRVYTGVHWPMDIVLGALIGVGVGFLFYTLSRVVVQKMQS